ERAIRDRSAHRPDMFEGFPTRKPRVTLIAATRIQRDASHGSLDAVDARMRGRDADRSAAVASNREWHLAAGNGRTRSRTGASGRHVRVPGVSGRFEDGIVARTAVAEFR